MKNVVRSLAALLVAVAPVGSAAPQQEPQALGSVFSRVLYLGDEPPEVRALREVHLVYAGAEGVARNVTRTFDETLELARRIVEALRDGADFAVVARQYSAARTAPLGGVLGTYPKGSLPEQFDDFLFSADLFEVGEPVVAPDGIHVMQRIETRAGCRTIRLDGQGPEVRERIEGLRREILAGASFAEVARRESDDAETAARGGALAVFERGDADRLLKGAVFRLEVGEVSPPIPSPLGWHLVERVEPDEIPQELVEDNWIRVRGIAILHRETPFPVPAPDRTADEAEELAKQLERELKDGADFEELARTWNDDFADGKGRAGLVGWVHRRQLGVPAFMASAYSLEPGDWFGPLPTNIGWVFVQRVE
ncbi:MAG: peptidylprolyl isomerase [Planctomycetota bacterium]